MALITAGFATYAAKGLREDLSDLIYNISPTDTPVISSIAKGKATSVLHEWQTDALSAASAANAQLEGDDTPANVTATATVRRARSARAIGSMRGGPVTTSIRDTPWRRAVGEHR